MPPKKAAARSKVKKSEAAQSNTQSKQAKTGSKSLKNSEVAKTAQDKPAATPPTEQKTSSKSNTSKKRKSPSSQDHESSTTKKSKPSPQKGTRTSARTSTSTSSTKRPTSTQIITYLLSATSLPHCYPASELSPSPSSPYPQPYSYALTPPHIFTPFQHLLSASLLSKPLSHVLGLRSIRTLLNPPFKLCTPAAITAAGQHRVWEALEQARTQHRQKSAAYVFEMAMLCKGEGEGDGKGEVWGEGLEALRKLVGNADGDGDGEEAVIKEIKSRVKGMGVTGAELFLRRVQCCEGWEACGPFADGKALAAVSDLGVGDVEDAMELRGLVEEVVKGMGEMKLGDMGLQKWAEGEGGAEMGDEQKLRVAFVVVLERALGASLEGNVDLVRKVAAEL